MFRQAVQDLDEGPLEAVALQLERAEVDVAVDVDHDQVQHQADWRGEREADHGEPARNPHRGDQAANRRHRHLQRRSWVFETGSFGDTCAIDAFADRMNLVEFSDTLPPWR